MGLFGRRSKEPAKIAYPPALAPEIEQGMHMLQALTTAHDGTWHLGEADWSVDQDEGG